MTGNFRCGHSREHSVGIKDKRCGICARARHQKYKRSMKLPEGMRERANYARYAFVKNLAPLEGSDPSVSSLPKASALLLQALWREHPAIMRQRYDDGFNVVVP